MQAGTTYSAVLGNVIKQLRDQRLFSQADMAAKMGITQAAWSKLESGLSTLSTAQLARVSDILDVPTNKIVRHADDAVAKFKAEGMKVAYDKKEADNSGLMLLGAAAIGLIILALINKK